MDNIVLKLHTVAGLNLKRDIQIEEQQSPVRLCEDLHLIQGTDLSAIISFPSSVLNISSFFLLFSQFLSSLLQLVSPASFAATCGGVRHPKLAGKLRFMHYLDEEQRTAMTIKSSSIALHYKDDEIKLIDSPGHMDFCSEVSTAARLSDGGLVLVDAVDGVHIQTHAVLRQSWIEKVNGIMSTYKSEKYLSDVDSILAGPSGELGASTSALQKALWGLRYFNPKTKMIVYHAALEPAGDKGTLEKVIKSFNLPIPPHPISAQSLRISRLLPKREILDKEADSNMLAKADLVRKSVEDCDSSLEAPCVAFVSKMFAVPTKMLPQRGPQGEILNNFTEEALYDPLRGESMLKHVQEAELQSLYLMMDQGLKPVTCVKAGNIVAIRGLGQHILKSATLSSTRNCWPFSSMAFQVSPTLRVAMEPSDPTDMGALMNGLRLLNRADPFVEVTVSSRGEHVLAAAGEVHLERCIKDLKERFAKVSLEVSPPLVMTSNARCTILVKVMKLPPALTKVLDESADLLSDIIGVLRKRIVDALESDFSCGNDNDNDQAEKCEGKWLKLLRRIWALGPGQFWELTGPDRPPVHGSTGQTGRSDPILITLLESSLMSGFQLATAAGPLCNEPMWGLAFVVEAYISPSTVLAIDSEPNQLSEQYGLFTGQKMTAVKEACRGAVLQRKPRLVEATYFCELNTPTEYLGPMYAVLARM
ncbi:Zinc finger C-x8-C-x5-C-x3-H type family protein, putative isoform 1 [Hibiscus syriacus]|uniref:Zinc finger C-x8-C-x5-C-x3-H type family protein, putative isoform 1 n=1 Tax=Hibiscus syriacus TaxID=106335 RepID=A0A6A3B8U6_HIBSY|nr:Zinc finger C-x8-C-x5-C-x3-H type family protein, putative isoform 1 [Hibiscus syriacus]